MPTLPRPVLTKSVAKVFVRSRSAPRRVKDALPTYLSRQRGAILLTLRAEQLLSGKVSLDSRRPRMADVAAVLDQQSQVRTWQEDFYRDLHSHPELSHQERRTAGLVAERLRRRFPGALGIGGTGVVGVLGQRRRADGAAAGRHGRVAGQGGDRAALRQRRHRDRHGRRRGAGDACLRPRHARGLPARRAQLLATAATQWRGTLVALFQPAEETGDGARGMVDDDLAKLFPTPDVALAQHVLPAPAGRGRHAQPGRCSPPRTACGSPCTGAVGTARCRRQPSTRSCWPR